MKKPEKLNPEQTYPLFYSELMPLMPDGSFYFVDNVRKLPTLFEKHVTNGDVDKALQLLATTIDDLEVFLQGRFHTLISLAAQSEHLIGLEIYQASINLKTKKAI